MKPQHAIAVVVVAVLATVVIEETRIAKMREQLVRLQALPTDAPRTEPEPLDLDPPEPDRPPVTEAGAEPAKVIVKDGAATPVEDPVDATEATPPPAAGTGFREVPERYPAPDDDRVKALALSPYALLHFSLALTPRECAYLDDLLAERARQQQELAAKWLAAEPAARDAVTAEMDNAISRSDDAIRTFLKRDADFESFAAFHALQPERELLAQFAPLMDAAGVSLPLEKEQKLVEAMHRARIGTGGIDWNSPEALAAMVAGDVASRFEKEWNEQGEALAPEVNKILSEEEASAFLEARQQVGETRKASLAEAAEALAN